MEKGVDPGLLISSAPLSMIIKINQITNTFFVFVQKFGMV